MLALGRGARACAPPNSPKPAWALYKFSLLYLALLFAAMVVDGLFPTARVGGREPLQLRNPDITQTAPALR